MNEILNQKLLSPITSKKAKICRMQSLCNRTVVLSTTLPSVNKSNKTSSQDEESTICKRGRRRSIFAVKSIELEQKSIYAKESIRRQLNDNKISYFKNAWERKKRLKKSIRLSRPHKPIILRWSKVNNPENKEQIKHITKHMSKENAELFKQLFKNLIN